jgi:hypothetical protein
MASRRNFFHEEAGETPTETGSHRPAIRVRNAQISARAGKKLYLQHLATVR